MLHQIPKSPKLVLLNINAKGILKILKTIPIKVGGRVLPIPLKAPAVPISIVMKNCDKPKILRYLAPSFIAIGSLGVKIVNSGLAPKTNKIVAKIPILPNICIPLWYPSLILSNFLAPKFWPTKADMAEENPSADIQAIDSI